ncbi:MgtC/SapB family protein [Petroclostridium sp. X23]|uniref:MgtC/SapB family protein n=1 Tax=Petroclostridium sp. X23 TaxID=3045146 RepID=UPI0024AE0BDA|nr:MgtC/SapB family protein [Petroclostridium sp. X23]WHH57307.1 MgtC/SapB family protein [Petroclostridium sp. X23]
MDIQTVIMRLLLAVVLSGLIGIEREDKNRPAGFRTHILVCVGSALVMITSEFIFYKYRGITNMDPGRMGSQVVSGIGFLGAGTIIRQGLNVKGLTTAASLWAIACVGLAAGIGFYEGAIAGAIIIYLTLIFLSRFGKMLQSKASQLNLIVEMENTPGKIGEIGLLLGKYDIYIKNIEFISDDAADESEILLRLTLKLPHGLTHERVVKEVARIHGVSKVEEI